MGSKESDSDEQTITTTGVTTILDAGTGANQDAKYRTISTKGTGIRTATKRIGEVASFQWYHQADSDSAAVALKATDAYNASSTAGTSYAKQVLSTQATNSSAGVYTISAGQIYYCVITDADGNKFYSKKVIVASPKRIRIISGNLRILRVSFVSPLLRQGGISLRIRKSRLISEPRNSGFLTVSFDLTSS